MTNKKSILNKLVIFLLAFALCFSTLLGCGDKEGEGGNGTGGGEIGGGSGNTDVGSGGTVFDGGIHEATVTDKAGSYLVKDGKSDYVIVVPASATARELTAANELSTFFEAATGITLPFAYDNDESIAYSDTAKYLSVGENRISQEAQVRADLSVLLRTGVRIVTKGESVFMLGADDYGTLNAVYEFLGHAVNYEVFSENAFRYNTDVKELALKNYDITEVPDFQFNVASHYNLRRDKELLQRFRMVELQEQSLSADGDIYHNTMKWLPPATYQTSHPDWYSTITSPYKNLCYNARGNKSERDALIAETSKLMIDRIKADPQKEYIAFGHMDTQTLCNCTVCNTEKAKYGGSEAAAVIKFLNEVRAKIQEWFDLSDVNKAFDKGQKILFFAYHATNQPPVKKENGVYVPYDEDVVCDKIVPWFAETNGDYTVPITETEVNEGIAENMKGWKALTGEILFWTYGTNFTQYLTPYNSFSAFQETYKFAAAQGVKTLYAQHQTNNNMSSAWERLKTYLNYKLGWNVNLDLNTLIDEFFEGYFGPAAPHMRKMFDEYRILGEVQNASGYNGRRSIFHNPLQAKYWPFNILNTWNDYMSDAVASIESLKETDIDRYNAIYFNIALERISPNYLTVKLYKEEIGEERTLQVRALVDSDIALTGVSMFAEHSGEVKNIWS